MFLEHLQIRHFRCIEAFESDLPQGRILIIGDNAQGKTTILEAVFYLVTGRSFRTRYDSDCVAWGQGAARVRGRVRRARGDSCRLEVAFSASAKTVRIDDRPLGRLMPLWGQLRAVLFTPDDLMLVKGGPSERRRYLDMALGQISSDYLFHLQRYHQALRQRNALLKRSDLGAASLRDEVLPWDRQMAEHGVPLLQARHDFLAALQPRASQLYARIAGRGGDASMSGTEALTIRYVNFLRSDTPPPADESASRFLGLLEAGLEEDVRRGQTGAGLHRDDFLVELGGRGARDFASQGQVRSCALALRLAEVLEMQQRTGDSPLVLLDDLASELDPHRKECVLDLLDPSWQTFLTTTRRADFPSDSAFAAVVHLPLL